MPGNIGHNAPPEDIGFPPYGNEDKTAVAATIAETRAELAQSVPDATKLAIFARRFDGWGAKIGTYLAKKGDLVVDELLKNSLKLATWGAAYGLFNELAHDLIALARQLLTRH